MQWQRPFCLGCIFRVSNVDSPSIDIATATIPHRQNASSSPLSCGTTALLMAGIFATSTPAAVINPIVAYNWYKKGKKVWKHLSHLGTAYSLGDGYYYLLKLNDPSDKGSKLKARPELEFDESKK